MHNPNELREKSVKELKEELVSLKEEMFKLRMSFHARQSENSSAIRKLRKNIARTKTIIQEKTKEDKQKETNAKA